MRSSCKSRICHTVVVAFSLALSVLLGGCAVSSISKKATAFSTAAVPVIQSSSDAYATVEQSYYDMQVERLVVNYDREGFHPDQIKKFLSEADMKPRQELLKGLQLYAQSLAELSGSSSISALDEQAKALGSQLQALSQENVWQQAKWKASDAEVRGATTAVAALGQWFIEEKRGRELPKTIRDMNGPIQQISALLISDIGQKPSENGTGGHGLRNQLWVQYDDLIEHQDRYIRETPALAPAERRTLIEQLPKLVVRQRDSDRALATTQDALKQFVVTHEAMLASKSGKDDGAFRTQIAVLIGEGARLKDFYDTLSKEK